MPDSADPALALPGALLASPQVRLWGEVNEEMFGRFRDQVAAAEGHGPLVVELMTMGGDADVGRRMAMEVRLLRERLGRRFLFLGVTAVYSAGATVMAAFPRRDRYLTSDAVLLIHCRRMNTSIELSGSLPVCEQKVQETLSQIRIGMELEREGFAELIDGTDVPMDEVVERANRNWYVQAHEALERRLVAGLLAPSRP